jgi:hypothetical protein
LLWQSPLLQMAMGCIIGHAIGCISAWPFVPMDHAFRSYSYFIVTILSHQWQYSGNRQESKFCLTQQVEREKKHSFAQLHKQQDEKMVIVWDMSPHNTLQSVGEDFSLCLGFPIMSAPAQFFSYYISHVTVSWKFGQTFSYWHPSHYSWWNFVDQFGGK